jgi:hypothetical protein
MKKRKKIPALHIDTFRDSTHIILHQEGSNDLVKNIFTKEEMTYLNDTFDNFYIHLRNNIIDNSSKKRLTKYKNNLREKFVWDIVSEISKFNEITNKQLLISATLDRMFYYADLVMAFVIGNEEIFQSKLKRHTLTDEEKKQFYDIIDIILKGDGVNAAIRNVKRLPKYTNSDLNKLFSNFRKNYKNEIIDYVKTHSKTPDRFITYLYKNLSTAELGGEFL